MIVFECEDKKQQEELLDLTEHKIIGNYLASRFHLDYVVSLTKLHEKLEEREKIEDIDLKDWVEKANLKLLKLHHIPKSSHWYIK